MDLNYIINHLGEEKNKYFNAVVPPIIQSTNFTFDSVAAMRNLLQDEMQNPLYTRGCNPTVAILRKKLAALENAEDAWVFSSGIAAMTAAVIAQVKQGDHVICVEKPYSWIKKLCDNILAKFGVQTTFIDGTKIENFENAINNNTTLIILESPVSITFEMQDIKAVAQLAKAKNITTIIDNSYTSPLYQKPLDLGIDIVMHTASKYLGGHSDVVAGCLMASSEQIRKIFQSEYMTLGATISPHDAWLIIRSLRTLPIRMETISKNTEQVVAHLKSHPKVEKIYYPFDPNNPQYDLAKSQMEKAPGLFSIQIKAENIEAVERFVDELKLFILAVSWGGYESLVFPLCSLAISESYSYSDRPFNLIRFYVGLDNPNELIKDLEKAFELI